jgi:hypothetical protein
MDLTFGWPLDELAARSLALMKRTDPKDYSPREAQSRTEAALRAAFNTPHKAMAEIPRKRPKVQRKPRKKATATASA